MNAVKLPKGLPKLPPVPAGYDAWEYMGREWKSDGAVGAPWGATLADGFDQSGWMRPSTGRLFDAAEPNHRINIYHYIRAIKMPAKPPAAKPRRESLTARMETAVQIGQREGKSAHEIVREINRHLDNHQRAKRRKEGK